MTEPSLPKNTLGVLSLDTAFPRILGDAGNPESYPFPTLVKVVEGADPTGVVRDGIPDKELTKKFVAAAQGLEAQGVRAIVSTCGFLITSQSHIAAEVKVPVMLSALSLLPSLDAVMSAPIAVLTASQASLGSKALNAAGIDPSGVVIQGLDDAPVFTRTFLARRQDQPLEFDQREIENAVVGTAVALLDRAPNVGAILLECGNLPPYAEAIKAATQRPVFHLIDASRLLMSANSSAF
jgi:hypothetical protein